MQASASHNQGACLKANGTGLGTTSATGIILTCDGGATLSAANLSYAAYTNPAGTENSYYGNCTAGNYSGTSADSLTGCGYLYNWYTATAGSGSYTPSSGSVTASICPAGWHLPYNTATNDFGVLNNAMATGATGSSTTNSATTWPNWVYKGPFEGSLSGSYVTGFTNQGYYGYYWSAHASSQTSAHVLDFNHAIVYPGNYSYNKYSGLAIRCLLAP
jgi:uncharacterized protein (TIGR02145 family)